MGDDLSDRGPSASIAAPRQECQLLTLLARMDHYVLSVDRGCALVLAQRTSVRYTSVEDIETCFRRVEDALSKLKRSRYRLLVDARLGPSRNDDTFEAALAQNRGKLLFGFKRNAALMATAAGRLQVRRYAAVDKRDVFVTDSPAAAFDYLRIASHPL